MIKDGNIKDRREMINQCMMWVLGGSHNPANLCSLVLGMALQHPEQMQRIREIAMKDKSKLEVLLHSTSNEVLRMYPPAQVIVRFAVKDFQIKDGDRVLDVKKDEAIIVHLQHATRHNKEVKDPLVFNVFRDIEGAEHIGFGIGPHRCMGGETGQLLAELLLENLMFADISQPKNWQQRDFGKISLKKFDWVEASSFKVIQEFLIEVGK